jgi:hypothetical protein
MHQQLWGYKVEWKSVSRGTGGKKVEYHCSRVCDHPTFCLISDPYITHRIYLDSRQTWCLNEIPHFLAPRGWIFHFYLFYYAHVCKVRGLTLLLRVGTLWRCGDGLFFEVLPLASDALLTTLNPLLENVLQTVYHFGISCLGAPNRSITVLTRARC